MAAPPSTEAVTDTALPWDLHRTESRLPLAERPGRAIRGGPRVLRRQATDQTERPYEVFGLSPLGPLIGAEITGVDLGSPPSPQLHRELHRALLEWKVIFFRDQWISGAQQVTFARAWGDLERQRLGAGAVDTGVARYVKDAAQAGFENAWHADMTGRARPARGFLLRMVEGPVSGGDTIFTDAAAAYDNLPPAVQAALEGLQAVHDLTATISPFTGPAEVDRLRALNPPVTHPVVVTHPDTDRKTLFVNSVFTDRVVGLDAERGERLLQFLFRQLQAPEYQVRFRWAPGSVAFWDNWAVQHYAVSDYYPQRRVMERVALAGGVPR